MFLPNRELDIKNLGLEREVAAHEEGHGDQFEEAFKSKITVGSGFAKKNGDKTVDVNFTGRIDQVLDQAFNEYDEIKNANPALLKGMTKEQYINSTFQRSTITVFGNMLKCDASENDANRRAAKMLGGGQNIPFIVGRKYIRLNF